MKGASAFNNDPDCILTADVLSCCPNQVAVDRGIKIGIINNYSLEKFNINNSNYKIYYYGNPKKLKAELLKFGYELINTEGSWQLYLNE